jgi:hypothetical protein
MTEYLSRQYHPHAKSYYEQATKMQPLNRTTAKSKPTTLTISAFWDEYQSRTID